MIFIDFQHATGIYGGPGGPDDTSGPPDPMFQFYAGTPGPHVSILCRDPRTPHLKFSKNHEKSMKIMKIFKIQNPKKSKEE